MRVLVRGWTEILMSFNVFLWTGLIYIYIYIYRERERERERERDRDRERERECDSICPLSRLETQRSNSVFGFLTNWSHFVMAKRNILQ